MNCIPSAKQSPRIENGVVKWYEGDTFALQLELDIVDQDGERVILAPEDTVTAVFRNDALSVVKEFTFTDVADNTITLAFDNTCTALFPAGHYTYDIRCIGTRRTTVCSGNEAEVA